MLLTVTVHSQDDFARWVAAQQAVAADVPAVRAGRDMFTSVACISCHTVRGTPANGVFGPDLVIGFNLTFLPMHWAGMLGMPRRIYTYPADRGWDFWNLLSSLGVPFQAAAVLIFVINVALSLRRGERAGSDPWDAWTLEWATASPPPPYNFETAPVVESRRPLWDLKHPDDPDGPHE